MTDRALAELGLSLADSFHQGLDRRAIDAAAFSRADGEAGPGALPAVWGIEDPRVLARLAELGLTRETVAALALTPLVEVAWADGDVSKSEREAVLEAASKFGLVRGDTSDLLLAGRLTERPGPELLGRWQSFVRTLRGLLDERSFATLRGDVMARARGVAEASGGLLGLGSRVSKAELAMLDSLEQSFG